MQLFRPGSERYEQPIVSHWVMLRGPEKGFHIMDYEGQICRPSTEKTTLMLAVAVGCSYNKCKFCTFFKHLKYRLLPMEQIEEELQRVRNLGGNPERIFLGDGNAFGMETSRLLNILKMVQSYFPNCRMINMDAAVSDIGNKTSDELLQLKKAGIKRLYLGIECGLDDVLEFMQKDHTRDQAYRQIQRLREAGLSYNAHMMTGIAGKGRGLENAKALAVFFNRTKPERIVNFSLFLNKSAPLYHDIQAGRFEPADEVENLREAYRLLELLDSDSLFYDGFHDHLGLRVWGRLPEERQKMLLKLEKAIDSHSCEAPTGAYGNF